MIPVPMRVDHVPDAPYVAAIQSRHHLVLGYGNPRIYHQILIAFVENHDVSSCYSQQRYWMVLLICSSEIQAHRNK